MQPAPPCLSWSELPHPRSLPTYVPFPKVTPSACPIPWSAYSQLLSQSQDWDNFRNKFKRLCCLQNDHTSPITLAEFSSVIILQLAIWSVLLLSCRYWFQMFILASLLLTNPPCTIRFSNGSSLQQNYRRTSLEEDCYLTAEVPLLSVWKPQPLESSSPTALLPVHASHHPIHSRMSTQLLISPASKTLSCKYLILSMWLFVAAQELDNVSSLHRCLDCPGHCSTSWYF